MKGVFRNITVNERIWAVSFCSHDIGEDETPKAYPEYTGLVISSLERLWQKRWTINRRATLHVN